MHIAENTETVTVQDAAEMLGVRRERIWALIKKGVLTATQSKVDGRVKLIPLMEIQQLSREEGGLLRRRRDKHH